MTGTDYIAHRAAILTYLRSRQRPGERPLAMLDARGPFRLTARERAKAGRKMLELR